MATIVITFFLFARFYVYKMDADWIESQRDQFLSRREKRWSMNSQRLEEIVAEVMKPISTDGRRSFDTDLSALLEEYLTEAGLRALEAEEDAAIPGVEPYTAPNFTEIALLLQQSANIYGRKVDFLYQHVLNVSDSLQASTQELANTTVSEEPQTPTSSRRKRKASTHGDFTEIVLEPCSLAARGAETPRPPPTLPRAFAELAPRPLAAGDQPLLDYNGDDIGLLTDFQVTWRLHEGMLVDELEGGCPGERALPLLELQAALLAAAPSSPPPAPRPSPSPPPSPLPSPAPLHTSTPLPLPLDVAVEMVAKNAKKERKRRSDIKIDDIFNGSVKIVFSKELIKKLKEVEEFSISEKWIASVIKKRKSHILSERKRLLHEEYQPPDDGFPGWSNSEAALALATCRRGSESDDDGFFEQSSGGDGDEDSLRADVPRDVTLAHPLLRDVTLQHEALDVRALAASVLSVLSPPPAPPTSFTRVLSERASRPPDVARLMLATLFLANAGNVEIVQGPALSMNSFSLRMDLRLQLHDELPALTAPR